MSRKIDPNDRASQVGPDGLAEELDRQTEDATPVGADRNGNLVSPILIRASDVQPECVSWLWEPYIPSGKLTMLQGNPGEGKTFIALAVSAIISRGWPLPNTDGKPGATKEPGDVLYLSLEDGIRDTLVPRLNGLSADLEKIHFLTGVIRKNSETTKQTEEPISFQDIESLRRAFLKANPVLMVADPIQGFLGKNVDFHRANEIRPILSGLAKLAEEFRCAVLCISHLRKGEAEKAIFRGLGSIDIVAAARSVLLAGRDPENPDKRAMVHIKSSLAEEGPSIGYAIEDGRLEWKGLSDLTAERLLARGRNGEGRTALEDAKDFLHELLASGPVLSEAILSQAKKQGISTRTLNRAKKELTVKSSRESCGNNGQGDWCWSLLPTNGEDEDEAH